MTVKETITSGLLAELYKLNILTKFNAPTPTHGAYGWLSAGTEATFRQPVVIEENVGIYKGPYKPFPGGRKSHGFASLGAFTYSFSPLPEGFIAGRYCSISSGLRFLDSAHPLDTLTTSAALFRPNNHLFSRTQTAESKEFAHSFDVAPENYPTIGHDVWIGADVTMSPQINVGTGAVIASGALVTKDVPPYAVVGGNPAKIIRYRFPDDLIARLLESHWWEYDPQQVFSDDPQEIISILSRVEAGQLDRYQPRTITLGVQRSAASATPTSRSQGTGAPTTTRRRTLRSIAKRFTRRLLH